MVERKPDKMGVEGGGTPARALVYWGYGGNMGVHNKVILIHMITLYEESEDFRHPVVMYIYFPADYRRHWL